MSEMHETSVWCSRMIQKKVLHITYRFCSSKIEEKERRED